MTLAQSQLKAARKAYPLESQEQQALFNWANIMVKKWPCLEMLFAIPNQRKCHPREGARFKAEGVKPGIPDIFLDWPLQGFHGLRIELKRANGIPSAVTESQHIWHLKIKRNGYAMAVAFGAEAAKEIIRNYIEGTYIQASVGVNYLKI